MSEATEVEKYKLTPEMLAAGKQYQKMLKMAKGLKISYAGKMTEVQQMRQMMKELEGAVQQLQTNLPQQKLKQLEGQDTSGKLQIRY